MEHRIEITRNQFLQLQTMTFNRGRITIKTSITLIEILQYQEIDLYLKLITLGVQVEQKLEADPDSCIDINRYKSTLYRDPGLWNIKE